MEFFRKPNINFIGSRKIWYFVSGTLFISSILLIIFKGFNLGADFAGGLVMQLKFEKPVQIEYLRTITNSFNYGNSQIQNIQGTDTFIIKLKAERDISKEFSMKLKQIHPDYAFIMERVEFVGPVVGRWLIERALLAFFLSFIGITLYVGIRFKGGIWGITGVLQLVHDVTITMGLISLTNTEMNITTVAALLTLVGYSINDSIVIYDRIRENLRFRFKEEIFKVYNDSVNETLSRSVITSLTVFFVILSLFIFGSESIHSFSFAMLFGVIIGSYSTIFIGASMVYDWKTRKK